MYNKNIFNLVRISVELYFLGVADSDVNERKESQRSTGYYKTQAVSHSAL